MKQKIHLNYITIIFLVLSLSCVKKQSLAQAQPLGKISVMTFNVENLFDTKHDKGKLDYTFLPLSEKKSGKVKKYCNKQKQKKWIDECLYLDWSENNLSSKMKNIANAILQVNEGYGPDVLILVEVENKAVLKKLVDEHLKKADYKTIELIEGKDERGIDVAVVSRLEKSGDSILREIPFHDISFKDKMDTRGILEVDLKLIDGTPLVVYANHFPAPFHKKEYRIQGFEFLASLMEKKDKDTIQIAGGDFNLPGDEDKKNQITSTYVDPSWIAAHKVAYKGDKGSTHYSKNNTWSFMDMLLVSKSLSDGKGWEWSPDSFMVADKAKGQLSDEGYPQSFDTRTGVGMSDHLPLYLEISKK